MATLERKKKPATITTDRSEEQVQHVATADDEHDLTNDSVLESLSKEPMEYSSLEQCFLSEQVVESLQSVKHICLNVLDVLLLQIVKGLPRNHQRRLSNPSIQGDQPTLLNSITQNTNLIQQELSTAVTTTGMTRSRSSPPATSISDVYRILDSNQQLHQGIDNQDYTLCCSLAALSNDVYRLLELNSSNHPSEEILQTEESNVSLLQQQLQDKVTKFQLKHATGLTAVEDASEEMKVIWAEMNYLMDIVSGLIIKNPPNYNDIVHQTIEFNSPPKYECLKFDTINTLLEKREALNTGNDLDDLLSAIDRLSLVAPRLDNQRVGLSEDQVKEMAAITLGKTVERLSRGRMEDQRAPLPLKTKEQVLQELVQQIQKSASRSLENQRVHLGKTKKREMEFASIHGAIKRLDKGRYTNQDWISHEELLINDLTHTTDLLVKSLHRPAYNRQRFSMSMAKERHLFMSGLFNKVETIEGYRLSNQDAVLSSTRAATEEDDLHQLLDRIYKSSKPQLNDQRASFT